MKIQVVTRTRDNKLWRWWTLELLEDLAIERRGDTCEDPSEINAEAEA